MSMNIWAGEENICYSLFDLTDVEFPELIMVVILNWMLLIQKTKTYFRFKVLDGE